MAEEFATSRDLNGLGGRVADINIEVGKHEERLNRSRDDQKETWVAIDKLRDDVKESDCKVQGVELNLSQQIGAIESIVAREIGTLRVDFEKTASKLAIRIASITGGISAAVGVAVFIFNNFIHKGP